MTRDISKNSDIQVLLPQLELPDHRACSEFRRNHGPRVLHGTSADLSHIFSPHLLVKPEVEANRYLAFRLACSGMKCQI